MWCTVDVFRDFGGEHDVRPLRHHEPQGWRSLRIQEFTHSRAIFRWLVADTWRSWLVAGWRYDDHGLHDHLFLDAQVTLSRKAWNFAMLRVYSSQPEAVTMCDVLVTVLSGRNGGVENSTHDSRNRNAVIVGGIRAVAQRR